jgi:hypothetical protein
MGDPFPHTCEDIGLTEPQVLKLTTDFRATMDKLRNKTLAEGKFAWQMLFNDEQTPDDAVAETQMFPLVRNATSCAADLRRSCRADSPTQTRAIGYGLTRKAGSRDPADLVHLKEDLASFLLIRGPFAWLGHGWISCDHEYPYPPEFNLDYGEPVDLCSESAPGSGVFTRKWTKAHIQMDCNTFIGTIDKLE